MQLPTPISGSREVVCLRFDLYDQASLTALAEYVADIGGGPAFLTSERASLMRHYVEEISPRALNQLAPSISYFDPEVSHALSLFPRPEGLTNVLQIRLTPEGNFSSGQDIWITWELIEAARRLYQALVGADAYAGSFASDISLGEPPNLVPLDASVLLPPT